MEAIFNFIFLQRRIDPYQFDEPDPKGTFIVLFYLLLIAFVFFIYLLFFKKKNKPQPINSNPIIKSDKPKYQEKEEIQEKDNSEPDYPPIPDFQNFINECDNKLVEPLKSNPIIIENR